jgi:hypothetical protein
VIAAHSALCSAVAHAVPFQVFRVVARLKRHRAPSSESLSGYIDHFADFTTNEEAWGAP